MKSRILIIDDDKSVRDSLSKVLQETGYSVELAADGREGAMFLVGKEFDLLVLDLDLPKLSGFDLLDIRLERQPALPVIILTGMASQCEPGALGIIDALLEKPADVRVLLGTIEKLVTEPKEKRAQRLRFSHPFINNCMRQPRKIWSSTLTKEQ